MYGYGFYFSGGGGVGSPLADCWVIIWRDSCTWDDALNWND